MRASANDRIRRVDAVFDAVLELPTEQQADYIERTCSEDPAIRDEVLQLLRAHHHQGGILDTVPGSMVRRFGLAEAAPGPDERIGPFRIIRPIGQGGMGQVYLGIRDDDQFEQRVALKLIRHPSDAIVRRFFEERRILAWLEHPRIARLIDGGITTDGMPYFAMEFVEGVPIDRFCETHDLPLDERLALFEQVCDAVSYAHQHLVIHRDLKPGNILVTADGQVKLLDFGIAKVLDPAGPEDETRTGLRIMTPEVAAPEQVRGRPVSTATDVYALGILLYQLIAGRRPYEVRDKSPAEFERVVCDVIPDAPSQHAPAPLRRRVEGDLDLIVMTALQKSESRRYQSPGALALDLHRFRNGFAISARPDTLTYRARKFFDRHRAAVIIAGASAIALTAGGLREAALRHEAEEASRTAMEVQNFLVNVFEGADPNSTADPGAATARTILDHSAARIDSMLGASPEVQAEMRAVLGRVYTNLGMYSQAVPLLERSLEQRRVLDPGDTCVASSASLLGLAYVRLDRWDEAEKLLGEALAIRQGELGNDHPATGESFENLATLYEERGRLVEAESLHREALRVSTHTYGDTSTQASDALNNVGLVLYRRSRYAAAESLYRKALAIQLPRLGEKHATTAASMHNLAQVLDVMGRRDSAERYYRRSLTAKRAVLGDLHPSVTIGLNNLGQFLAANPAKLDEAEAMTREAVALDRKLFGDRHTFVAEGLRNLGIIARAKGRFTQADSAIRAALEMDRALVGERDIRMANLYGNLSQVRQQVGDMPGAIRLMRESLSRYEELAGTDHRNTNIVRVNLARMIVEGAQPGNREAQRAAAEAESLLVVAIPKLDSTSGASRQQWIIAKRAMGEARLLGGHPRDAVAHLGRALELSRREFGDNHLRTANARLSLGRALLADGNPRIAGALLAAADSVIQQNRVAQPFLARMSAGAMAQAARASK